MSAQPPSAHTGEAGVHILGEAGLHTPGEAELHIAGVLVHLQPAALDALQHAVGAIDGAEVYQHTPDGRAVLVLEAPSAAALLDTLDTIRALPGVFNVSLAYQHAEPLSAMQEEMKP